MLLATRSRQASALECRHGLTPAWCTVCHPLPKLPAVEGEETLVSQDFRTLEEPERSPDPVWEVDPERCWEHTQQLSQAERLLFQECARVDGKVVGCHEVVVATPWDLTAELIAKRLGCGVAPAAQLADCWAILDVTPAMVETFLGWVKARGVAAGLAQFQRWAMPAAAAEAMDPEDALEHRQAQAKLAELDEVGVGMTPELALLLEEGVPSAALIAHRCGIPLAQAGEVREALILQCFAEAVQAAHPATAEAEDGERDEALDLADGVDVAPPPTLDWHLLDEADEETPWLERQPFRYQRLLWQVRRCPELTALKALGKAVYAQKALQGSQAAVFWTEYELRKAALLRELSRPQRLSPVATRWLARIQATVNLAAIGRSLYRLQAAKPPGGPWPEEWTVLWAAYQEAKAHQPAPRQQPLRQRA